MPFSVTVIPWNDPTPRSHTHAPTARFLLSMSLLTHPFHQKCMAALQSHLRPNGSSMSENCGEYLLFSVLPKKPLRGPKYDPGILCPPPDGESDNRPWLYLLGTFKTKTYFLKYTKSFLSLLPPGPLMRKGNLPFERFQNGRRLRQTRPSFLVNNPLDSTEWEVSY